MTTSLDQLRHRSKVSCDTLDVTIARDLGPFVDCTSNQAIAWAELSDPVNESVIIDAIRKVRASARHAASLGPEEVEIVVEYATVLLALRIVPFITGTIHIQVNPRYSYQTEKIIANAERIVTIVHDLQPDFGISRVCIKIPSTWEGLQACKVLEQRGIKTLATTAFNMEQALLAGECSCSYIAPYVNELRVHFDPAYKDPSPNLNISRQAQEAYAARGMTTKVLPASLTSAKECLALAGADYITISPPLLQALTDSVSIEPSIFDGSSSVTTFDTAVTCDSEAEWKVQFSQADGGQGARKQIEAIDIFCSMQDKLEVLVQKHLGSETE